MATRSAENPVGVVARKLHIGGVAKEVPRLSLPGKLVFPSIHNGRFSMLGLGDIVSFLMSMKLTAKCYIFIFGYAIFLVYIIAHYLVFYVKIRIC